MFPLSKTFASLGRANLLGLIVFCALLALLLAGATVALLTWLASRLVDLQPAWLDTLINLAVGLVGGIGGWFMLPPLMALIAGIFQESIISRVERVFYPEKVRKEPPRFWADLRHDMLFLARALALNLLILPLYLVGIGFVASIALNSYLLGREFFEAAAGYHLGKPAARRLGQRHRLAVYGGGCVITLIGIVPLVNLLMPVLATVWMVHLYHALPAQEQGSEEARGNTTP